MNDRGTVFEVRTPLLWRVAARVPGSFGAAVVMSLLLALLLLLGLAPSAASPPAFTGYVAVSGLLFAARPGWFAWRWWRYGLIHGPPRIGFDTDAVSVIADGHTTRLDWADVAWVGAMTGVPLRPGTVTLVAALREGAPPPPRGYRRTRRWYEPQPQWYPDLGVVRLCDLDLLAADPPQVADAADRYSRGKWRGDRPATRTRPTS